MRKLTAIILLLSCISAACSGAGAAETTPTATPAPIIATSQPTNTPLPSPTPLRVGGTLTIRHSWGESELPVLVQIIDGFRQKYPEVYFDVLYVPAEDLKARYESEYSEGRAPLLLLGPAEWGSDLFAKGMIADLNGLIDDTVLSSLNPPALVAARSGPALVGLPYGLQGVALFRNKDVITISPTTLEELTNLAQTTTQGSIIGAYLERSFLYSGGHLNGVGGRLMDENGLPAFADPKGSDWIELLRSFELAGPPDYNSDDDLLKFKAGSAGWIIDGTWNLRSIASELGPENVAIDPWPATKTGKLSGYVFADMLYLNAQADAQQRLTAQTFMQYFVSVEAQAILAQSTRIPANIGAKASDPALGTLINQAMAALAEGTPYPNSPYMTIYSQNIDIALRAIFDDNANPEEALSAAAEAIRGEIQAQITPTP
jgi:arabinogalactan oligomer/maltooligosaccharide transport system substrate-binding protein